MEGIKKYIRQQELLNRLNKNQIDFNYLVMREEGDKRDDTIIKSEMFNKFII